MQFSGLFYIQMEVNRNMKCKKKGIDPARMRCQYCGGTAVLRSADGIYRKNPNHTMLYVCSNYPRCDAYSHMLYYLPNVSMPIRYKRSAPSPPGEGADLLSYLAAKPHGLRRISVTGSPACGCISSAEPLPRPGLAHPRGRRSGSESPACGPVSPCRGRLSGL